MKSGDIAALLVQGMQQQATGTTDLGWHTGIVLSWDEQTGVNSIQINGNVFNNLLVLSMGAVTPFQPGDVVGIIRVRTQYFVLGKTRAPGAGAGERIASSRVAQLTIVPPGGSMADLAGSFGPSVTLNIGSSRRALVIHSCEIIFSGSSTALDQSDGYQGVAITGATNRAAETAVTNAFLTGNLTNGASVTATTLVTAADGLNQGQNTFTCKYRSIVTASMVVQVNNRVLTVIPF